MQTGCEDYVRLEETSRSKTRKIIIYCVDEDLHRTAVWYDTGKSRVSLQVVVENCNGESLWSGYISC